MANKLYDLWLKRVTSTYNNLDWLYPEQLVEPRKRITLCKRQGLHYRLRNYQSIMLLVHSGVMQCILHTDTHTYYSL